MKKVLLLLLLANFAISVNVSGDIYEEGSLKKLNSTVVTLKGADYSYRQVFQTANYSFSLPEGRYKLIVERYDAGMLTHQFNESVNLNGNSARIDFVLRPTPSPVDLRIYAIAGIVIVLILIIIHRLLLRHFSTRTQDTESETGNPELEIDNPEPATQDIIPKTQDLDEDARRILETLKANEGRMTQKELRELLNYSDAKMSLIIAELEHYGMIKKFKRGRGNILKIIKKEKKSTA